ncbi:MAG TPA: SDR family NAD(P)-dependent oxidoreductase [Polyangia bacterium]|nr:SDR family NAD(P)-dependent oxidoreductase [Polyangia bacterium]
MTTSRRALIVGNTDGIGLALTRRLLRDGWLVVGLSRRASPVEEAPSYRHALADVSAAEYRLALQALLAREAPFDVCVYCAGIGDLLDINDLSREAGVVRVNLIGAVETASVVLPPMIAAGRGHFVGLSSIGDGVWSDAPSYSASKAGLSSYLEGLALRLRPRGVRITNLRFGFVDTKMAKSTIRPFMITTERAVEVILKCFRRRPARLTYPKGMAALAWLLQLMTSVRLWFA